MTPEYTRWAFSQAVSNVSQKERIQLMEQLIIDCMDYTEQTDNERLWWELYDKLIELKEKYK